MHWSRVVWVWLALGLVAGTLQFLLTDWAAGLDPDSRCRELELTQPAYARVEHAGQERLPPGTRCSVTACAELRRDSAQRNVSCARYAASGTITVIPARDRDLVYLIGSSVLFTPLIALLVVAVSRRRGWPGRGD